MARVLRLLVLLSSIAFLLVSTVRGAGDRAMTRAVKGGDLTSVRKLIATHADVNDQSGDGSTPLLWAAHSSNVDIARALLGAGAKADIPNNYGITPLLEAS